MESLVHQRFYGFRAQAGVSRWDITPQSGSYAKNWGAAKHWFATGVHRRLTGTALALTPLTGQQPPLLLVSLELGWWRNRKDADALRRRLLDELELPESNVIIHLTHTHSGPALDSAAPAEARPEAARAYLAWLSESCLGACREALGTRRPATALFHCGHCGLAAERDFPDPDSPGRYLCGFHPAAPADDTLLVARLFGDDGRTLATLVNYACHPTTLAWENSLLSPDYPGAMRELVEEQTGGVPCLFFLGAAGELAPAEQYSGDVALADRHGRELGHAALAALSPLATGHAGMRYDGLVESGAPLAVWRSCERNVSPSLRAAVRTIELEIKKELPTIAEIDAALAGKPEGYQYERLLRQRRVRGSVGDADSTTERVWLWQLGEALVCAFPFEAYSILQTHLRQRFAPRPILVMNLGNGSLGYLPPRSLYEHNIYTVWQTPFAAGGLEKVMRVAEEELAEFRSS